MPFDLKWQDFWLYALVWAAVAAVVAITLSFYSYSDAIYVMMHVALFIFFTAVTVHLAKTSKNRFHTFPLIIGEIGISTLLGMLVPSTEPATGPLMFLLSVPPFMLLITGLASRGLAYVSPNRDFYRGTAEIWKGRYQKGIDHLSAYILHHPDDSDAFFVRSHAHRGLWQLEESLDDVESALTANYRRPWQIHSFRGWTLILLGDVDEGVRQLETARRLLDDPFTRMFLGEGYLLQERYNDAKKMIDGSVIARQSPLGRMVKGAVHQRGDRAKKARNEFRLAAKSVRKVPARWAFEGVRALALAQMGEVKKAAAAADTALERNERDVDALHALALCSLSLGDTVGAARNLERIAQIAPGWALVILDDPQFEPLLHADGITDMMGRARADRESTLQDIWSRHPGLREPLLQAGLTGHQYGSPDRAINVP